MKKLLFASLFTLTLLSSFVFGLIILVLLYLDAIDIWFAISLTIVINFILWLIGPSISDLINKWFHKVKFISREEFSRQYPEVAQIIEQVSTEYKFSFPKIGIIPDKNPTAFTYGSARYNARIIITEGIFHFLSPQQARAVIAHELGHIVNRDFIVMMIASTLLQILYEIYAVFRKAKSSGGKSNPLQLISLLAYVLYIIGIYLVLFLSRTRESFADEFSTKYTEPKDLANALIRIAYGIVEAEDTSSSTKLLGATRHLGIIDIKNAKHFGMVSHITDSDPKVLSEVMVFDKLNPWAKLAELNSTHPLTGNRLDHLGHISRAAGKPFPLDAHAAALRMGVKRSKMYLDFFFGMIVLLLPYILSIIAFYLNYLWIPAAFGIGLLLQIPYRFQFGVAKDTTVLDQMRNPYASTIRGSKISLSGQVIGRGVPGYIFGEDMMYQDPTGLVFLNYSSSLGFIGNIFFALKKIKTLFSVPSKATGWFYRGTGSFVSLSYLETEKGKVRSHPILWKAIGAIILVIFSAYLILSIPIY